MEGGGGGLGRHAAESETRNEMGRWGREIKKCESNLSRVTIETLMGGYFSLLSQDSLTQTSLLHHNTWIVL